MHKIGDMISDEKKSEIYYKVSKMEQTENFLGITLKPAATTSATEPATSPTGSKTLAAAKQFAENNPELMNQAKGLLGSLASRLINGKQQPQCLVQYNPPPPPPEPQSNKTWWIVGGCAAAVIVLVVVILLVRRK